MNCPLPKTSTDLFSLVPEIEDGRLIYSIYKNMQYDRHYEDLDEAVQNVAARLKEQAQSKL